MYLALDIGSVLIDVDFTNFLDEFCTKQNVTHKAAWDFLTVIQPLHDLGISKLRDELKAAFNLTQEAEDVIMQAWLNSVKPNATSIRYLTEFLDAGVQVALLSNMGYEHNQNIANVIGPSFDRCIKHMSCEVGARKPQLLFYQSFLLAHYNFHGCVYVDDREENLIIGTKMKFKSHNIDTSKMSPEELITKWEEIKTLVNQPLYKISGE